MSDNFLEKDVPTSVAKQEPVETTAIAKVSIETNGKGLALRNLEDMYRFGQYVVKSGIAPKSFDTPEKVIIAIQSGAEQGMGPMRSLQSFCVINGMAKLFGDAPLARVRESGLLEYINEYIDGKGDERVAICTTKRKGDPEPKITRFSIKDAKQANLLGKGPWVAYLERMLMFRARSFNLRDNFPDALCGAGIAEEYEGHDFTDVSATVQAPKSAVLLEDKEKPDGV